MQELRIEASVENLPQATAFVTDLLEAHDCPIKEQMQIEVATEELFVNIAHYAYAPESGEAVIRVRFDEAPRAVAIDFIDSGRPFDPTAKEDPDVTLPAGERPVGGLGIYMVKKSMDTFGYAYQDGQNIVTIGKAF